MTRNFYLFDMDGVLLKPNGYHQSLRASVIRIGKALGAPLTDISDDQIAHFESLSVTNEWDTLAICTALILLQAWKVDGKIRLNGLTHAPEILLENYPDFDTFLNSFSNVGGLPGQSAYIKIINDDPWLNQSQRLHLKEVLYHCRDIYRSLTLSVHQESVLGSHAFQELYKLQPNLNTDSFLLKYDRPILSDENKNLFRNWLNSPDNYAGILTNRPSSCPPGFLSAPEAELGAKLVGFEDLPILGSGLLAWFAITHCQLRDDHTFLKPNPVHALALLQLCIGLPPVSALKAAVDLWRGDSDRSNWVFLENASVTIFEDAVKGLQCGIAARDLLKKQGISINLQRIGVTYNHIKRKALEGIADIVIPEINQFDWT